MSKQFMVTVLPVADYNEMLTVEGAYFSNDYGNAFDEFNRQLSARSCEPVKLSRSEKPLRAEMEDCLIELWVIGRADSVVDLQNIEDAN